MEVVLRGRKKYYVISNFLMFVLGGTQILHAQEQTKLLKREEWGAHPATKAMQQNTPTKLTIHHTGTAPNYKKSIDVKLKALQSFSQTDSRLADGRLKSAWADVPYHYYIDVEGKAAEGRQAQFLGDSNTTYDLRGHLSVVLEGNFDSAPPTDAQVRALTSLLKSLAVAHHIRPENIGAHKQFAKTACPGRYLMTMLPKIRADVAALMRDD
ncbi:hypothetical protein MEX01_40680 [Methylorubrum extorquens]|nr:peptidoglycan recognition family protein [Methylorubrum extorquens]GEL43477.1 hypothetical protein MEX01_40680 [Methylorubrum extorquens]